MKDHTYAGIALFLIVAGTVLTFGVLFPLWQQARLDSCMTIAAQHQARATYVLEQTPYHRETYAALADGIEQEYLAATALCGQESIQ